MVDVCGEAASEAEAVLVFGDWLVQTQICPLFFDAKTWSHLNHPSRRGDSWVSGRTFRSWETERVWETRAEAFAADFVESIFDEDCDNLLDDVYDFRLAVVSESVCVDSDGDASGPETSVPHAEGNFRSDLVALAQDTQGDQIAWRTFRPLTVLSGKQVQLYGKAASKAEAVLAFGDWLVKTREYSAFYKESHWSDNLDACSPEIAAKLCYTLFNGDETDLFPGFLLSRSCDELVTLGVSRTKSAAKRC